MIAGMADPTGPRSSVVMLYALWMLTVCCVVVLVALPRALAPEQTPQLVLDRSAVATVLAADRKASATAPKTPLALELDLRFLELGAAEDRNEPSARTKLQRQGLARIHQRLVGEAGEAASLGLRAAAMERLEAALSARLSADETRRVLGVFPEAAARHHATRDGNEVAPHFVLRTLYKARWNLAMGLAADHAFAPVEGRAYHGWLALHAHNLGPGMRSKALLAYERAGGRYVAEAQGVLAFLGQDYEQSVAALTLAYQTTPSLRVRNWLRGAQVAAAQPAE